MNALVPALLVVAVAAAGEAAPTASPPHAEAGVENASPVDAVRIAALSGARLWSLAPTADGERWVEIHATDPDGSLHVEVIGRRRGAPVWEIRHLAPHLAISPEALARSVGAALARGSVYPETFDDAFARWRAARERGEPVPVCTRTVDDCLAGRW